jgi:hypothetical protein
MKAAKARGVKLGNPNGARALRGKQVGNREAIAKVKANADERAVNLKAILTAIQANGVTSVRRIAEELNRRGVLTPRGATWHPTSVVRLLQHLQAATSSRGSSRSPEQTHLNPVSLGLNVATSLCLPSTSQEDAGPRRFVFSRVLSMPSPTGWVRFPNQFEKLE